ncbi:MAG: TPM domain-containing protein [Clostridia bacterium]|nr:TPM domain-containing protein [Clostridia bacterium]
MKKKILILLMVLGTLFVFTFSVGAADLPLVYDEADLLTDAEESALLAELESISDEAEMDVAVALVDSIGELSAMEYADDYFDYNGFGRGDNRDGLVLLISMENSDWWISTRGDAITAFTDAGIEYIGEKVIPYLSEGEYAAALNEFAAQCDTFIAQAKTGDPFDTHNLPKNPFNPLLALVIALIAGFIIGKIYTGKLKGQLNTVRKQAAASGYVRNGSLNVTNSSDFFLYRNVVRTAKESSDSDGGSSTHKSSSGASHGGGGGKF